MNRKYIESDIKCLSENYPKYGAPYCAKVLGVKNHCIYKLAKLFGIKKEGTNRNKHPSMMSVSTDQFQTILSPYVSYFLGFFWADGNIHRYTSKGVEHNSIRIEAVTEDMNDIMPVFNSLGKWSIRTRQRNNWRNQTVINTNNRELLNFLKENDYDMKSQATPQKILERIPDKLKVYFWRGFFDGDGTISFSASHKNIGFCGSYSQNWKDLEILLGSLGIKYGLYRTIEKTGNKYSKIAIQNKQGIVDLINYFSPTFDIGLKRKTKLMLSFIELHSSESHQMSVPV
jgi:hypothetical protein